MKYNHFFLILLVSCLGIVAQAENQVQFLPRGEQSLSARMLAIDGAQTSIDYITYIFEPCDSSTKMLLEALIAKAKAGLKVRMIIDAYELKSDSKQKLADLNAYLKANNIEMRYYNAFGLGFERSHIKLMVIDGKQATGRYISGGRNTSDAYFGLSAETNYLDHDLAISGSSLKDAQSSFDELWDSQNVGTYDKKLLFGLPNPLIAKPDLKKFTANCLTKNQKDAEIAQFFKNNSTSILESAPKRICTDVSFFIDNDKFRNNPNAAHSGNKNVLEEDLNDTQLSFKRTTKNFLDFIAATKENVVIHNQFYIPSMKLKQGFKTLRSNNKKVLIFTNRTGDAGSLTEAMTQLIRESAKKDSNGSQLVLLISSLGSLSDRHALTPETADHKWRIHTKTAVRDHQDIFLGSFNLDKISYKENLEEGMIIRGCADLVKDIEVDMLKLANTHDSDLENCPACKKEIPKDFLDTLKGKIIDYF